MDYPASYYAASRAVALDLPRAHGDMSCDVCVIGGGYTGLSAALHLAERGYDVVVLEAGPIGFGASGRNGGQLGLGFVGHQQDLARKYGADTARAFWDVAEDAKELVKGLIKRHDIACDYTPGNMGCAVSKGDVDGQKRHVDFLVRNYCYENYEVYDRAQTAEIAGTDCYLGAVYDASAGHLHPLNYALGLARAAALAGARIYEHSPATKLIAGNPAEVQTGSGMIRARFVVVGCNGYLGRLLPQIAGRILPADNYQLASEPLPPEFDQTIITNNSCLWDTHSQVYYYRKSADKRLIFGGGLGFPGYVARNLKAVVRKHMLNIYPQLKELRIDYSWSGTFASTLNLLPDFGRIAPNIFYGQGYTGHGVGLATLGGQVMAEVIDGTAARFDVLACVPHMGYPGGAHLRLPVLGLGMLYLWLRDRLPPGLRDRLPG